MLARQRADRAGRQLLESALGNAKLSEDDVADLRRLIAGCGAVDATEARHRRAPGPGQGRPGQGRRDHRAGPGGAGGAGRPRHRPERLAGHGGTDGGRRSWLAGLSAAIHLAAAGRDVVVVEAEAVPGGRCGTATAGGYRFDTGPSGADHARGGAL